MNAKPEPQRVPASEKPAAADGAAPTLPAHHRNQLGTPAVVVVIVLLGIAATWTLTAPPAEPSLFVMMYTPGPNWDTTRAPIAQLHFGSHSANLARLRRDSVIVAGGRFGPWGLILVAAENEAAARALFEPDSSLAAGVFRGEIHRWTTLYEGFVSRR